jgi:Dullard-like phosphatase family protein
MSLRSFVIRTRNPSFRQCIHISIARQGQRELRFFSALSTPYYVKPSLAMGPRRKYVDATAIPSAHARAYDSDLVVVLDMDECLIHSQFMSQNSAGFAYQTTDDDFDFQEGELKKFDVLLPDGDLVQVNQRPYLLEFLDRVTERFETHVFTAAMKVYAKPVLDNLDPTHTKFTSRWYRDSCDLTQDGTYVKNLSVLQKNEARIVLVDNNPISFLANPSNGILVKSFYNDASDDTLLNVLDLLHELDDCDDVRPYLDQKFGLASALEQAKKEGAL